MRAAASLLPNLLRMFSYARGGGVSRVAKGADCKSAVLRLRRFESYLSHQPSRVALRLASQPSAERAAGLLKLDFRGCSSMVEQQPSKLKTRVRFPLPAPLSPL